MVCLRLDGGCERVSTVSRVDPIRARVCAQLDTMMFQISVSEVAGILPDIGIEGWGCNVAARLWAAGKG